MAIRYFRNGPARALAFPLANSTDTSITVDSASGFPTQYPYTLILDPDQATEEVVEATAAAGNVITLNRGIDGTTAVAHAAGTVVYHGVSARDPREANEHVNATANVHGRTGELVDTDSEQSIPGRKIFSDAESVGGGNFVDVGSPQTVTGLKTFSQTPQTTTNGAVATLGGTQTFTGTKTFTNTVQTGTESHSGTETHSGTEVHTGTAQFANAAMRPVSAGSTQDETITSTTFVPGVLTVGLTFTCPPSGRIYVTLSAYFSQPINGQAALVGFALRNGATIGSGTVVLPSNGDRALVCGDAVNTGAPSRLQASRRALVTGLNPGDPYNVVVEMTTTAGGSNQTFYREILVEPVF